ncbi:uncharacterized protein B4U80_11892, partial [Leptotrombidium deliense]
MKPNAAKVLCFLILYFPFLESSICPTSWSKINDKCIYIGLPKRNKTQNQRICAEVEAEMITFESNSDYSDYAKLIPNGEEIYTAATRVSVANGVSSYLWNGKKSDFKMKWNSSQPDEQTYPDANCITLFTDGYLYDRHCDLFFPTACQINLLEIEIGNKTAFLNNAAQRLKEINMRDENLRKMLKTSDNHTNKWTEMNVNLDEILRNHYDKVLRIKERLDYMFVKVHETNDLTLKHKQHLNEINDFINETIDFEYLANETIKNILNNIQELKRKTEVSSTELYSKSERGLKNFELLNNDLQRWQKNMNESMFNVETNVKHQFGEYSQKAENAILGMHNIQAECREFMTSLNDSLQFVAFQNEMLNKTMKTFMDDVLLKINLLFSRNNNLTEGIEDKEIDHASNDNNYNETTITQISNPKEKHDHSDTE